MAGTGGKREGAGRPKGSKTVVRREPTKQELQRQLADRAAEAGMMPLEFMLKVMRDDEAEFHDRLDAAKSAAPYCHVRLQSIEHKGDTKNPVVIDVKDTRELARRFAYLMASAARGEAA